RSVSRVSVRASELVSSRWVVGCIVGRIGSGQLGPPVGDRKRAKETEFRRLSFRNPQISFQLKRGREKILGVVRAFGPSNGSQAFDVVIPESERGPVR